MKIVYAMLLLIALFTLGLTATGCAVPALLALNTPTPAATPFLLTPAAVNTLPAALIPTQTPVRLLRDGAGRQVKFDTVPQRIISLAPNVTEILFALDLGKQTVGVDAFSDYPADVKNIAKVSGPDGKFNFEQIVALKPDVVYVAGGIASPDDIKKLEELKLTVVVVGNVKTTFDSVFDDIYIVGLIHNRAVAGQSLTDALRAKYVAVTSRVKVITTATKSPRVYWELDATDPAKPFTVGPGNFVNDIITLAGGVNIFADAKLPFAQVSAEQIIAANPDVIILSDAAYGVTVDSVLKRAGYATLNAVKKNQVYPIDDNLVSRPGPRVVDGLEAAAKLFFPDQFK